MAIQRKARRWLGWAVGLVVVVAILAGGAVLVGRERAKKPVETAAARPVVFELSANDVARAERMDLRQVVRISGTLNAVNQTVVKAEVAAPINEVLVQRGQPVDKGQVLARLDTEVLKARLAEKQSNLDAARSQRALAERTNSNSQTLRQKGIVSEIASEQSQSNLTVAAANVQALTAQVDQAKRQLNDAVIRSPMTGVIGERWVNGGENAVVDAKLFTIVDLNTLEAEALVPAREVPKLNIGQEVRLKVEGFGTEVFLGRIDRINPSVAAGTRAIPVFVRLSNQDNKLKVGMFATGKVIVGLVRDVVAIPEAAIRRDNQQTFVFLLNDGRLVRRPVTVGLTGSEDDQAEITTGMAPGDITIVAPFINLTDGMAARLAAGS